MTHEIISAVRSLRTGPLTSLAAIVLIAVGIGVNTAVFAVTYDVLFRSLPYADPSRLVIISIAAPDGSDFGVPLADIVQWRQRLRTIEAFAGYTVSELPLRGSAEPRMIDVALVTDEFFDVLGVRPQRGSLDAIAAAGTVAVLSERAARYSSVDAGSAVSVGDCACTAAAVMPREFAFPTRDIDAWLRASMVLPPSAVGPSVSSRG